LERARASDQWLVAAGGRCRKRAEVEKEQKTAVPRGRFNSTGLTVGDVIRKCFGIRCESSAAHLAAEEGIRRRF
jgi:hypothetical protein